MLKNINEIEKLIQLTCDNCGKLYDKPITEYNHNIRLKKT